MIGYEEHEIVAPPAAPAALPAEAMPALDALIVTHFSDLGSLERLVDSLAAQQDCPFALRVALADNSCDEAYFAALSARSGQWREQRKFAGLQLSRCATNAGVGSAVNLLLTQTSAEFVLMIKPDACLATDALARVFDAMSEPRERGQRIAGWELRQSPYEHPKAYDPVSQHTRWISSAAGVYRRRALAEVGGFEPRIFTGGDDVDLSWRLGARGWALRYVPAALCWQESYDDSGVLTPVQAIEGYYANLCLRARFGTWRDVLIGTGMMLHEISVPSSFPRRRVRLVGALLRFLRNARYFRGGRWREALPFPAEIRDWGYGATRVDDYCAFPAPGTLESSPLVSIVVRTQDRWPRLRNALISIAQQTYRPIETIVVEDGEPATRERIESEFGGSLRPVYACTGYAAGRSRAGNLGLSLARGEWINFLDDDDELFADHVEVLVRNAVKSRAEENAVGVYGLAWEMPSDVLSQDPLQYRPGTPVTRYREPFSRAALWDHDFMPIQTVMFHRSCWERFGGFDVDMHHLADWNLWTRYTASEDFVMVNKTTSIYRVPADSAKAAARHASLDASYAQAINLQGRISVQSDIARLKRSRRQDMLHATEMLRQSRESAEPPVWRRRWFVRLPVRMWQALRLPEIR